MAQNRGMLMGDKIAVLSGLLMVVSFFLPTTSMLGISFMNIAQINPEVYLIPAMGAILILVAALLSGSNSSPGWRFLYVIPAALTVLGFFEVNSQMGAQFGSRMGGSLDISFLFSIAGPGIWLLFGSEIGAAIAALVGICGSNEYSDNARNEETWQTGKKHYASEGARFQQANGVSDLPQAYPGSSSLLKRTMLCIEFGDFDKADEILEYILNNDPELAEAYIAKLMVELELKNESELRNSERPLSEYPDYRKAMRFASGDYKAVLEGYNQNIIGRNESMRKENLTLESLHLAGEREKMLSRNIHILQALILAISATVTYFITCKLF